MVNIASMKAVWSLFQKDVLLEFRQQHAFFGLLLYLSSTVFVLYLAVSEPSADVWNGLFWVIQLFVCVTAVAKSFLQEGKGRMLYFYLLASPQHFILSKLLFNVLLMAFLTILSLGTFIVLLGNPIQHTGVFVGIVLLGSMSMSLVFTLLAAIAARAQQNAALMAILGFPLIVPQLLLLMRLSKAGFGEVFKDGALFQMTALLGGLNILVIALSLILFPFLWKD